LVVRYTCKQSKNQNTKKMKTNVLLIASLLVATAFTSCRKEEMNKGNMISELAGIHQIVTVPTNNFDRIEAEALNQPNSDAPYTAGTIEYHVDGAVVSRVVFDEAGPQHAMHYDVAGGTSNTVSLQHEDSKDSKWKKVIVEPLVYSDECGYVVAGIIKLYEIDGGEWVATFDYGDGTCDDLINKDTADGNDDFSMSDYPEWNWQ
jgi:hypothetical protein